MTAKRKSRWSYPVIMCTAPCRKNSMIPPPAALILSASDMPWANAGPARAILAINTVTIFRMFWFLLRETLLVDEASSGIFSVLTGRNLLSLNCLRIRGIRRRWSS